MCVLKTYVVETSFLTWWCWVVLPNGRIYNMIIPTLQMQLGQADSHIHLCQSHPQKWISSISHVDSVLGNRRIIFMSQFCAVDAFRRRFGSLVFLCCSLHLSDMGWYKNSLTRCCSFGLQLHILQNCKPINSVFCIYLVFCYCSIKRIKCKVRAWV